MGACCDLEVDVNGEETFMVNKNILSSFCNKFSTLLGNLASTTGDLKVIFNDFPGGAHSFELITRFCYNGSRIVITSSNIVLLYCASHYMEMKGDVLRRPNLIPQIKNFLEGIHFWTWSELMEALKQCQDLFPAKNCSTILDIILDNLIERLTLNSPIGSSPYACSSNRSSFQFSCETSSTMWRNSSPGATWWFQHLRFLKIELFEKVIRRLTFHNFDKAIISKFLFYYHKLSCLGGEPDEKREKMKIVIDLISLLDKRFLSCKDLFNLYWIAVGLKIGTCCKNKLECVLGLVLDQATVDYLLIPSQQGRDHAYDVDMVLRLSQIFVLEGDFGTSSNRLKRVANLMDPFLVEVAPDPHLEPSEFAALIAVLPQNARESHDQLYIAMDMYLKLHAGLGDKEKQSICCALDNEKLSAEFLRHLNRNSVFPSGTKSRVHVSRQSRIRSFLQENDHLRNFFDSTFCRSFKNTDIKADTERRTSHVEDIRLSAGVRKLKGELQGMQNGTKMRGIRSQNLTTPASMLDSSPKYVHDINGFLLFH